MMKQQKSTHEEFIEKLCQEINNIQEFMDELYQQEPNTKESVIERIREQLKLCAQDGNPFKAAAIIDYVFHNEPVINLDELHIRQDPYVQSNYSPVEGFDDSHSNSEFVHTFLGAVKAIEPIIETGE